MGDTHLFHRIGQALLDPRHQTGVGFFSLLLGLLGRLVLQLAQVQLATGDGDQLLAVELGEVAHQPLVHPLPHQQHFDALLAEDLQMRAVLGRGIGVGGDVVNLLLAFLHAANVILKRHCLGFALAGGAGKAQQLGDLFAVGVILGRALFEHIAELAPELGVLLAVVLGQLVQHGQHPLGAGLAQGGGHLVVLQDLAADVERQIVGVQHPFDEAQVGRHKLLGVIHDEDALHVELQTVLLLAVVEIERCAGRYVEQAGVLLRPFHPVVAPQQGVFEVVSDVLVELLILLVLDVLRVAGPERGGAVDLLPLAGGADDGFTVFLAIRGALFVHLHRYADVVGILGDHGAQAPVVQELLFIAAQVQDDVGAATLFGHVSHGEGAFPFGFPLHALARLCAGGAGDDGHLVGDDEGGVEAHPELTDQLGVLALIT
ncbi:hypothetical protein D3C84_556020 [compost metagenome]